MSIEKKLKKQKQIISFYSFNNAKQKVLLL